ncbi:pectinesterase 3-like [Phalaenopsis equestris]|uniref:pectinesterase 3-like n=1 Tax=Phalaenopsis equestris TaxID=78828 RepID=UPI0009E64590|nr:pectinesterase 3-like [Phalaenopsis equestris]
MDSLKSFNGYGKMDPAEDREFRRKTKIRLIFIAIAVLLLIAIVAGVAISVSVNKRKGGQSPISASSSIKAVCSLTRYPDSCFSSLSSATSNSSTVATDPAALFQISLVVASRSILKLSSFLSSLEIPPTDIRLQAAINDCKELLGDAVDRLNDSNAIFTRANPGEKILSDSKISDLKTWLSATITDQATCLDGFEGTTGGFREKLETAMVNSTQLASNSLAIATGIVGIMKKLHFPINRKLLATRGQSRVLFKNFID